MAQTIKIKRTTGNGKPSSVAQGELFYAYGSNGTYGKRLSIGNSAGGTDTPEIIGGSYYTNIIDTAASTNTVSKLVLRDGSGNFSAGTITATLTGNVTGNVTGNTSGTALTVTQAAQAAITSLGTLTTLTVDNLNINGNTILANTGALNLTPAGGSAIVLDGTINVDAGVVTGATSITSTAFVGSLSTAAQTNVTSLGTLTALQVDNVNLNGNTLSSSTGALNISPATGSAIVLDGTINVDAGVVTGATSITSTALVGELTGNAATATQWATARNLSLTGDATATFANVNGTAAISTALTLATVNSNTGQFGTTTAIPVITVNAKGLVTAMTTAAIQTSWDIDADTGTTNAINGGDTLSLTGGTGVDTSVSGNVVTFAIGQPVATTSNVTFNNVAVDGTLTSDDITAATMTASGHVIVQGNLTVNGTTTTVNSNTVAIGDAIMTLNSDETGTPSANGGLEIERGTSTNVSLLWDETNDYWKLTEDGSSYSKIMTAGNFAASFTGILDGGTYS
jgi:trimeric autotransporter adhesin